MSEPNYRYADIKITEDGGNVSEFENARFFGVVPGLPCIRFDVEEGGEWVTYMTNKPYTVTIPPKNRRSPRVEIAN